MLGFGHDSGVVRIGVLDAFPVLVLAVDLAGFIAGSVCLRAFRRSAVALAAGEGMDGEAPAVRGDRHMGRSRGSFVDRAGEMVGWMADDQSGIGRGRRRRYQNQNNGAFEAVKSALTAVAGIGGVAYLVIKYRTEQRETAGIADKKISAAVDQLGSDKASTRIAGVYALTDIADRYKGGYRQRVVDILCGYLRSDREAYPLGADGKPATGLPRSGDADKAVESTILSMFVAHLKRGREMRTT